MLFESFNIILTSKLYIMNKQKQLPNVKLQKTSVIFMQLGLILALLLVYLVIEHESFYKPAGLGDYASNEPLDDEATIKVFEVEKKIKHKRATKTKVTKVKPKQKIEPKVASDFKAVKDDKKIETTVFKGSDVDEKDKILTASDIDEVDTIEVIDEEIPFTKIEFAPEFPGCKGTTLEKKQCFSEKVRKIVQRNFNTDLAQDLGLSAGKKRVNVQFVVDKEGNIIDIQARGTHKRLEKEAKRVIKLLPKMKPARQGHSFAKVRFGLPIVFMVED